MALTKVTYPMIDGVETITTPDVEAVSFVGRTTDYTGGTVGFVGNAIKAVSNAGANVTNFEWAITGVMNNSAAAGENVGVYGQGNKLAVGSTWGMVAEAQDKTGVNDPVAGLVGIEVDCRANGTDANFNRLGIHIVATKYDNAGAKNITGIGILIDNNADATGSEYGVGIFLGNKGGAVCKFAWGIDMGSGTFTSGAIRIPDQTAIAFDTAGVEQVSYDTTGILYKSSGVSASRLNKDGTIAWGGSTLPLKLGVQSTGTTLPAFTANKPGSSTAIGTWISVTINGLQRWIPAWEN